ncbi:hypothetical protein BJX99DRAFT_235289 [Aspergillus californicus]
MYTHDPLPRHYESEEEAISESETGHAFSPVDSSKSAEPSPVESGRAFPRLLSPFPSIGKGSRPGSIMSMDTVKRSSTATFVTESYTIFDQDDDMIIELPSPDTTAPLQSPIFLQPSVYVPSPSARSSFRSTSSMSLFSDDESDVRVAEQVTYVEPLAKPNLILISPTATEQSSPRESASPDTSDGSLYSCDEAAKSQPVLGETSMDRGRSRHHTRPTRGKVQGSLSQLDTLRYYSPSRSNISEPMSAPAIEAPMSMSFRASSMSFSRPQTPITENRRRVQNDPPRPPSVSSTATFSLFPSQAPVCQDDFRSRSMSCSQSIASSDYSVSSSQPTSRTASPTPYYSQSYNRSRSGSLYSVSSMSGTPSTGKRPPMPYRGSFIKGSSALGYSSSSLRSELESRPLEQLSELDDKPKSRRKKSLRHLKSSISKIDSPESSAKSFVGFMLRSKRKSVIKTV